MNERCAVCGAPATVRHHRAPKAREKRHGRDPDRPGNPIDVCGACHEHFHADSRMGQQPYSGYDHGKIEQAAMTAYGKLAPRYWCMLPDCLLEEVRRLALTHGMPKRVAFTP